MSYCLSPALTAAAPPGAVALICRCGGICDDDTGMCFCDNLGGSKYARIPPPEGSSPGTPLIQEGRPLPFPCSFPANDSQGNKAWGYVPYQDIYGPQGWCVADVPEVHHCGCNLDGWDGLGCSIRAEAMCPNQCSGMGGCIGGFCKCFEGRFGMDCAYVVSANEQQQQEQQQQRRQEEGKRERKPWLENISLDAWECYKRTGPCKEDLTARYWRAWEEEDRKQQQQQQGELRQYVTWPGDAPAQNDTANATEDEDTAAAAAAAAEKKPGRVRPLIYIYNTPSQYQSRMYQYRKGKGACSWRLFYGAEGNRTDGNHLGTPYAAELALLESLMMSKHRTLNPEEADFFYVPVAGTCFLEGVVAEGDWPWFYIDRYVG